MKIQYLLSFVLMMLMVPNVWPLKNITVKMGASDGFYWKPYNGKIPQDAVPATPVDDPGRPSYIGRAPTWNGGMLIGELIPLATSITVTGPPGDRTVHVIYDNIEILCSAALVNFHWTARNRGESIKPDLSNFIQGGFEREALQPLIIGRARVLNGLVKSSIFVTKPARIALNEPDRDTYDYFRYPLGNTEGETESFEVLMVDST